ncbi:hypothetical protein [Azospirillum brasilense]|uniref:hypothetical protein n=1 Tax=Azospirillum brasilense TaxID=192 RepID=UPI0011A9B4A0|nr:hypothetical protein [Azospirillum brasilense]
MSASIRVLVKASRFGPAANFLLVLDRTPVQGDYIHIGGKNLVKVNSIVLFNNNSPVAAFAYADHDPNDSPDEAQ